MAARWNLDPFRGFEAGFRMRRNIEAVRMDMQDRENLKAAQAQMAAVQEEEEKSETRIRLQSSQETYRGMMRQLRDYGPDHPETPDREQIKAARNLMDENFFQLVSEKNQRYQTILNRYAGNQYVEKWIGGLLADNNLMAERFAEKLADGEQSLTQLQVTDMRGDQAESERQWQSRESERDRRSAERVAAIQASGRSQPDPAEYAREARDYVTDSFDEDEIDEIGKKWGMRPSQVRRAMNKRAFDQLMQGESPDLNQFILDGNERFAQQKPAEAPPEPKTPRERGRASRRSFGRIREAGPGKIGDQGQAMADFNEWWEGFWEGEPIAEAAEQVGAVGQ